MWPDKDNLSMRPQWYLPTLDRDLQVPLSPSPSKNLACGVGCPEAPGSPDGGRYMARENVQGSIITTKDLISDHSGYMTPPFSLVNCREAASNNCSWQETVFLEQDVKSLFLIYLDSNVRPHRRMNRGSALNNRKTTRLIF